MFSTNEQIGLNVIAIISSLTNATDMERCKSWNRAASDVIYFIDHAFNGGLAIVCSPQTHDSIGLSY